MSRRYVSPGILLEVCKISKYASSLMSSSRDEMTSFVTGVTEDCKRNVRHLCFMITWTLLMVHEQQIEKSRRRKRG